MYQRDAVSNNNKKPNPFNSKSPPRFQSLLDTTDQLQCYACTVAKARRWTRKNFHFTADIFRHFQIQRNILSHTQIFQVFSHEHDPIFERLHSSKGQAKFVSDFSCLLKCSIPRMKGVRVEESAFIRSERDNLAMDYVGYSRVHGAKQNGQRQRRLSLRADQQALFRFMYILKEEFGM